MSDQSYYYFLNISYLGTDYHGWQIQDEQNVPTIQGALVGALEKIFSLNVEKIIGSGRTDRGVHAINQYASLKINRDIPVESMSKALNDSLPVTIFVKKIWKTREFIHPLANILSKNYIYLFSTKVGRPFYSDRFLTLGRNINIDLMKSAAKLFEGTYNFSDFKCQGTETLTDIKTVSSCQIMAANDYKFKNDLPVNLSGDLWLLSICADGFLKQMVRMIMGALCAVGKGALRLEELELALKNAPTTKRYGAVAGSHGLYLMDTQYSWQFNNEMFGDSAPASL